MGVDRRKFIKFGGVCAIGLGAFSGVKAFATGNTTEKPNPNALTGKRWVMVIDTRKCAGDCTHCIDACHGDNNVPEIGVKDEEIQWIKTDAFEHVFPYQKHDFLGDEVKNKKFLALCNHCDKPSCVRVCPTKATFKKDDGIVTMDMHRCIGCRYCMAACPYAARTFNFRDPRPYLTETNNSYPARTKGVVEKCTFCTHKLARGEQPSCVGACPNGALVFGDIEDPNSEVRKLLSENHSIVRKPYLGTKPSVYYIV
ncbi:molybdopterin-containing oxidoreductase family iron-sulfur binding subunit [Desulfitispora alkaliphila]|uniref:sulfate reduction electron transfer complex DsrMKJOP subunit DsrO n=1 Tax=Desulfitispora alkaliphila TaxID=622674 RepID=UPI003D24AF02